MEKEARIMEKEREMKEVVAAIVANLAASQSKNLSRFQINLKGSSGRASQLVLLSKPLKFNSKDMELILIENAAIREELEPLVIPTDDGKTVSVERRLVSSIKEAHENGKAVLVIVSNFDGQNASFISDLATKDLYGIKGPMAVITIENYTAETQLPKKKDGKRYDIKTEEDLDDFFLAREIDAMIMDIVQKVDLDKAVAEVINRTKEEPLHPLIKRLGDMMIKDMEQRGIDIESESMLKDEEEEQLLTGLDNANTMLYAWEAIGEKVDKEFFEKVLKGFVDELYAKAFLDFVKEKQEKKEENTILRKAEQERETLTEMRKVYEEMKQEQVSSNKVDQKTLKRILML